MFNSPPRRKNEQTKCKSGVIFILQTLPAPLRVGLSFKIPVKDTDVCGGNVGECVKIEGERIFLPKRCGRVSWHLSLLVCQLNNDKLAEENLTAAAHSLRPSHVIYRGGGGN